MDHKNHKNYICICPASPENRIVSCCDLQGSFVFGTSLFFLPSSHLGPSGMFVLSLVFARLLFLSLSFLHRRRRVLIIYFAPFCCFAQNELFLDVVVFFFPRSKMLKGEKMLFVVLCTFDGQFSLLFIVAVVIPQCAKVDAFQKATTQSLHNNILSLLTQDE